MFPFATAVGGQRIGQPQGDELRDTGGIIVRQITALMPAAKAFGLGTSIQGNGPRLFAVHELLQAGVIWRGRSLRTIECTRLSACRSAGL